MNDSTSTTYPKTLAALRDQEDRSWAVADALVEEIKTHDGGRVIDGEYDRCSAWLSEQGYDVTAGYLRTMRVTSVRFSEQRTDRRWQIPFRLYLAAAQSPNWTPDLMDQAEREGWTLRQFSEKLTGKRWADTDTEAAKRILRDPEKLAEVSQELEPEEAAGAAAELHRRAWQTAANPPSVQPWVEPPIVTEREIREAAAANPLGGESLGPPLGIMEDLAAINAALGRIEIAATNSRIDWTGMRDSVIASLTQKQQRIETIKELINSVAPGFTEDDYNNLLREGRL